MLSFPRSAWERKTPTLSVDAAAAGPRSGPPLRSHAERGNETCDSRLHRRGLTLVELLVTIMIISILAAMILGVAAVAGNSAREAKSRNMVTRLHTLLAEQADSYKSRRVNVRAEVVNSINLDTSPALDTPAEKGRALAEARLYALRELMLMEMPDRWSDVLLNQVSSAPTVNDARYPVYLENRSDLANIYLRRYLRMVDANISQARIQENQSAECLYMVITLACGDGEARSLFHESDIGDTDGDGAPEFLDGWGNPISFLRWAPGFDSLIQANANLLDLSPPNGWRDAANAEHDPYDMYRIQLDAYRLMPLVYSAGRDEAYGIYDAATVWVWTGNSDSDDSFPVSQLASRKLIPYQKYDDGTVNAYLGTADPVAKTSTDNIHNHLIGTR